MTGAEAAAVRDLLRAALGELPAVDAAPAAEFLADRLATAGISDRQREVLEFVADGLTEAEIGRRLFLSPTTVKTHKAAAFKALGARSAAQAVATAFRRGLIT